ncbi:hypothetical protein JL720_9610 [Aureococcus anophagefferens]|nr:hypothetical protein JL720_9610 [Aureococcus anophagefferens]
MSVVPAETDGNAARLEALDPKNLLFTDTFHCCARTTDDGEPYFNRCEICDVDRPKGARHCYDCGVCVMDLDHHCPLIGKCVGAKTIDRFQLTLIAVTVNLALVSILSIAMILGGG